MWKNRSFAFRLNFVICLLSILSILSITLINSLLSRGALENEIRARSIPALTDSLESEITKELSTVHACLQYISRWPFLIRWLEDGEKQEDFPELVHLTQTVVEVFKTGHINITVDRTRHFYEAVDQLPQTRKTLDARVDRWFDEFKASGRKIFTNLHAPYDPEYGGLSFVNARIENARGEFLGIISAPFDMSSVAKLLATEKIGRRGRTFIARPDGTVLLHSNPDFNRKHVSQLPGIGVVPPDALKARQTFFQNTDNLGRRVFVGVKRLDVMEAILFTVVDEEELFEDIDKARNYSLAAALAVLGVIMLAGLRAGRIITLSMRRIIRFAGKVAANEASEPFEREGDQEMRELADALNDMNMQLRRSNLSLQSVARILDGLDASLMVTDPETDEILFSNSRLKKDFLLAGDPCGHKCWRVLYLDKNGRCDDCPAEELLKNPDKAYRRQVINPFTKRHYEEINTSIEWTDGRPALLIQRLDVHDAFEAREALKLRLAQLELALNISQSLFSTEPSSILIDNALAKVGEFMGLGRLRVSRYDRERGALACEHEWLNPRENVPSMLGSVVSFTPSNPLYASYVVAKKDFAEVNDITALSGLVLLPAMGVKAFVDAPIYVSGELWGVIGADDCQGPHQWTNADSYLLRLVSGLISGLLFRRAAEAKLLRMTSLVEEATQYITYIDRNGQFQYFNGSTCALMGYSPEELSAGGLPLIFSESTMAYVREHIIPNIIAKGRLSFELPITRKDGVRRIFSFEAFSIGAGEDVGIGAIGLDITEKRQLEDQLITAKEAAEKSSHAKSAFLSRMSHEIRTPLNAVMGMVTIALNTAKAERKSDCLEKINVAAAHLLDMINEILDLSNMESDKFELRPGDFCFETMVGKLMNAVRPEADKKGHSLSMRIDPAMPHTLYGDEQRLGQALANILENAVKFTPKQGQIELRATVVEAGGQDCVLDIAVADTGIGIPHDKLEFLFQPFEQLDGGVARRFEGAGLGLVLARRIVEMMDGSITVAANQGGGTVFTVRVRLGIGRDAPEKPESPGPEKKPEKSPGTIPHQPPVHEPPAVPGPAPERDAPPDTAPAHALLGSFPAALSPGAEDPPAPKAAPIAPPVAPPVAETAATAEESVEKDEAAPEGNDFSGCRILLAEDVEINREIVLALLEPTGVTVDCAENGRQAIDMFLAAPDRYQLIFMDINMPEVDGYEAVAAIRSSGLQQGADVPVVAMTANTFDADIQRCLDAGMNGHLGKPIMVDKLMDTLARYLKKP